MKLPAVVGTVVLLALAVLWAGVSEKPAQVELAVLNEQNWEQFVPRGKEVDAIYGDFVLRNGSLAAVIAQPLPTRNANMTVKQVGGALIDLAVRDAASDQLSAFYPGKRNYAYKAAERRGPDGKAVADQERIVTGDSAALVITAEATDSKPEVQVRYRLAAGKPYLEITSTYTNRGDKPLKVTLEDDLRADGQKEDMVRSPNGETDTFWLHDRFWGQAYGLDAPEFQIQSNSDQRTTVLKYQKKSEDDTITLPPGKSYQLTRRIYPGRSLLDVKAVAAELRGEKLSPVTFAVRDGERQPIASATVEVLTKTETRGTVRTDSQGVAETRLPRGEYQVQVSALGVPLQRGLAIRIEESRNQFEFNLANYRPGMVEARITDDKGQPIPCKIEFSPTDPDMPKPNFGPDTAEFGVRNLRYAPLGKFTQPLPPGRYNVTVSHGPEFDALFTELDLPPGKTVPLIGKLVRTVETPGWVSGDFHSHSSPSGDNTSSQLGRVLNLLCEHVEFAPCTEHNRITTYTPHIESLGVGQFIGTTTGMELTGSPLPLNHQNAFPLKYHPRTQDGGAPIPDDSPEKQIERLALWDDRGDKLVQQNHPDIGWMFYDRDGDGKRDSGYERMFGFMDVIEIHPIDSVLNINTPGGRTNNRLFNWLQLLNQGFRIPGVVNTDAHYNYHGSGWLRNWIQSPTDDPAAIQPLDIVHAAEQGRVIVSNGPYLEVSLKESGKGESVTAGQDLKAPSGKVALHVRARCPNWLDIDRVFVLINGRIHTQHDYRRDQHADAFRSGVVKFERDLELTLDGDAHIIVVAAGEKEHLGSVMGPDAGKARPAALSNPIFVDVDGNGFRANGDTLDAELPVKYEPPKK